MSTPFSGGLVSSFRRAALATLVLGGINLCAGFSHVHRELSDNSGAKRTAHSDDLIIAASLQLVVAFSSTLSKDIS